VYLPDLDVNQKMAIVFGNEVEGLSSELIENADIYMKIPMYGFTESFNISVSAAITMYNLTDRLRKSGGDYHLSADRRIETLIKWAKRTIRRSDMIEKELMKRLFSIQ
jgi:tRNA (guanosine-2'-O-)-methyltransferase